MRLFSEVDQEIFGLYCAGRESHLSGNSRFCNELLGFYCAGRKSHLLGLSQFCNELFWAAY